MHQFTKFSKSGAVDNGGIPKIFQVGLWIPCSAKVAPCADPWWPLCCAQGQWWVPGHWSTQIFSCCCPRTALHNKTGTFRLMERLFLCPLGFLSSVSSQTNSLLISLPLILFWGGFVFIPCFTKKFGHFWGWKIWAITLCCFLQVSRRRENINCCKQTVIFFHLA